MNDKAVTVHQDSPPAPVSTEQQVRTFNPLDADPQQFAVALQQRSANYDLLAEHLRGQLIHGKDFGRIHIANKSKCPRPWECSYEQNRGHWSGYALFASGADKVLGTLGLAVNYPDEQDYRRAALTGKPIDEVIAKALIVDRFGQVLSEGMGAAGRDEHQGSLNNTLKKALKRARLDAVLRIPSVSALFEEDFLSEIAGSGGQNTVNSRARTVKQAGNTGAELTVMPFGPFTDEKFCDLPDSQIAWCLNECNNQDVKAAAQREHNRRVGKAYRANGGDPAPGASMTGEEPPPLGEGDFDDEIPF